MEKDHFYFREINEKQGRWVLFCFDKIVHKWHAEMRKSSYVFILYPRVCLSRETQVAKRISNCCVSSLVKTSISTKISLLRLSPSQRLKTHQLSAVKIQNVFITMWFLPTRRTHIAISSCLFQTIAVSLPPLRQKRILKMFHSPGLFCRTEEGRRASWHAQQWQSQLLTMLRNVRKHEQTRGILQTWCCSYSSAGAALLNLLKLATNTERNFDSNKAFIEKRLVLDLVIDSSLNLFFLQTAQIPWKPFFHCP